MVKPRSDSLSLEIASALKNAPTIQNAPNIQTLVNNKDTHLNSIFTQSEFQYLRCPQRVTKNSSKENLIQLIDKDKIISSFRVSTLHNILTEAIAMLTLSSSNPFDRFSSDPII